MGWKPDGQGTEETGGQETPSLLDVSPDAKDALGRQGGPELTEEGPTLDDEDLEPSHNRGRDGTDASVEAHDRTERHAEMTSSFGTVARTPESGTHGLK